MVRSLFTTCSCVDTSRASVCVSKPFKVSSAQRRSSHLSKFRYQWRQRNCFVWLQHRRSDPNSTAIIFQCMWCQFTAECFVQQAAVPSFAWRQSFDCSGFHHSTCGANEYCVRSVVPSLVKSWTQRAQTAVGWLQRQSPHSHTELCPRGNSAPSHISFVCCLAVSTRRWCTLAAHGTSHVNRSWSAGTSAPEADPTASLIDLTCASTAFTELSAAPLDCGSPSADVSCTTSPVQGSFTALSSDGTEGSLPLRNTTLQSPKVFKS